MSSQQHRRRGSSPLRHVQNASSLPQQAQPSAAPQMSQKFPQQNATLATYGIHSNGLGPGQSPPSSASGYRRKPVPPRSASRSPSPSPGPSPPRYYAATAQNAPSQSTSAQSPSHTTTAVAARVSSRPSSPLIPSPPNTKPPTKITPTASATVIGRSHRRDPWLPLAVLIASATFAVTAWFARATFSNNSSSSARNFFKSVFRVDITDTLTILALLSGILAFLLGFVVDNTLDIIQWALICRAQGADLLSVLAISSTTGALGTLGLLVDGPTPASSRLWAAGKLSLRIAVWIAGIALFINTSVTTLYRAELIYPAIAGVGPFDGSLFEPYLQNINLTEEQIAALSVPVPATAIPYTITALTHNLVVNPQHSIASPHEACNADIGCDSYVLPGGLGTATFGGDATGGAPPINRTDLPAITLGPVPATRLDFHRSIWDNDTTLTTADCDLFWQDPYKIAVQFCLAPSRARPGSVLAAFIVCDLGSNHITNECLTNTTKYPDGRPSIRTTFSVARLQTSMVVSRANYSIFALTDPSTTPIPDHSIADTLSANNLLAYKAAINWMLNNTAAGIPAPSGIIEYFWNAPLQLGSDYWSPGPRAAFESLLAFPFWFWQANNHGNPAFFGADLTYEGVLSAVGGGAEEFQTSAGVGGPAVRIVVDEGMFIAFVVLVGAVLVVGWVVCAWLWFYRSRRGVGSMQGHGSGGVKIPKISSYPAVDLALRTREVLVGSAVTSLASTQPSATSSRLASSSGLDIVDAGDKQVRRALRGRRVVFDGDIEDAPPIAGMFRRRGGRKVKSGTGQLLGGTGANNSGGPVP